MQRYRPRLERFEEKQLLTASPHAAHGMLAGASHLVHAPIPNVSADHAPSSPVPAAHTAGPGTALTLFRITNPSPMRLALIPPFNQVLVQPHPPVPGEMYNVLYVAVRNGTARTFNSDTGLNVRITGAKTVFPVLTGTQVWKPGQVMVFYILTKRYYPLNPIVGAGFQFDLNGQSQTAIPGPTGIYLRVKYVPGSFPRLLNWIVAHGPGSRGHELGLPDTAVWQITSARTNIVPL
jgi:hypothetical protein